MGIFPEGKAENPKGQARNLDNDVRKFIDYIRQLPDSLFFAKIDDWSPRDITAHLIGWNIHTINECQYVRRGETPPEFTDPGEDFSKVNAVLVKEYNSTDKSELIQQLESSAEELKQFIADIDPEDWDTDYGVTYRGGTVTMKNCIDGLIFDYEHHRQQIESWAENKASER